MIEIDDSELDALLVDDPGGPVVMLNLLRFRPDGGRESYQRYAAARPGLAILATADQAAGAEEQRRRAADRAGARVVVLEDLGHWWMTEEPARGAAVLTDFWATID